jgi:flagellar biosynthetic protein FliR
MTGALVIGAFLVFLRIGAFVAFLPPFMGKGLPNTVKIGLSLSLTLLWLPVARISPTIANSMSMPGMMILGAVEVVTGLGLAACLGLFLVPMKVAGSYITQEMGLDFASQASLVEAQEQSIISQILEAIGTLMFFVLHVDHVVYRMLGRSLELHPVGGPMLQPSGEWLIGAFGRMSEYGVQMAAPIGAVLFITSLVLLIVAKWAPQVNMFTVGFQIRLLAGLTAIIAFLPELCRITVSLFQRMAQLSISG